MKESTAWLVRIAAALTALALGTAVVYCLLSRLVSFP